MASQKEEIIKAFNNVSSLTISLSGNEYLGLQDPSSKTRGNRLYYPDNVELPTVATLPANPITPSGATLWGEITDTGGENVDQRGFRWRRKDSGDPWTGTSYLGSFGTGTFSHTLSGLPSGITYEYQAYAHNSAGWAYGALMEFKTTAAPSIVSINPSSGFNNGKVRISRLEGANFHPGTMACLRKTGFPDIPASNLVVVSDGLITCEFDLTNATPGLWDVVVVNPDMQEGILPAGFTIKEPPAPNWYLAEGSTDGGMETFLLVQNPGPNPVHVNIKFQTGAGQQAPAELQNLEIGATSRRTFKVNDWVTDYDVSTFVEALDGELICERAMYGNGRSWAHDSIGVTPRRMQEK